MLKATKMFSCAPKTGHEERFEQEVAAYEALWPQLRKTHLSQWVAIKDGDAYSLPGLALELSQQFQRFQRRELVHIYLFELSHDGVFLKDRQLLGSFLS